VPFHQLIIPCHMVLNHELIALTPAFQVSSARCGRLAIQG
jgi:hypothetical protein